MKQRPLKLQAVVRVQVEARCWEQIKNVSIKGQLLDLVANPQPLSCQFVAISAILTYATHPTTPSEGAGEEKNVFLRN
jgi:hypothetical protein